MCSCDSSLLTDTNRWISAISACTLGPWLSGSSHICSRQHQGVDTDSSLRVNLRFSGGKGKKSRTASQSSPALFPTRTFLSLPHPSLVPFSTEPLGASYSHCNAALPPPSLPVPPRPHPSLLSVIHGLRLSLAALTPPPSHTHTHTHTSPQ